jgi:hypothetical protein
MRSHSRQLPSTGAGRWRAVVAGAGGSAAVVASALVVANVHKAGQTVTIRPAAQAGPAPGTIFVSNVGPYNGTTYTSPGSITSYPRARLATPGRKP